MADRVNASTEKLLPIFKQIQIHEILTPKNTQNLLSQITNFEYKIARNQRTKENYYDYMKFYEDLLDLLGVKRKLVSNFEDFHEIEGKLISKLFNVQEQAVLEV